MGWQIEPKPNPKFQNFNPTQIQNPKFFLKANKNPQPKRFGWVGYPMRDLDLYKNEFSVQKGDVFYEVTIYVIKSFYMRDFH